MKSSFNDNASPSEILTFATKTLENAKTYQDGLETVAISLLPLIKEARLNGEIDAKVSNIPMAYDWLRGDLDYLDIWDKITSTTPETLKAAFSASSLAGEDAAATLKKAAVLKSRIEGLPVDDYVTLARAMESILPPGIRAAVGAARNGRTLEDEAKETHAMAALLTPQEIAEAMTRRTAAMPVDGLVEGVHALMQQCTPERLEKLIHYIDDNYGGAALGLLVKRGWDFAEETLQAASDGNFMAPANPAKIKAFGRALGDTLTVLEEGLTSAGFTMPEQISRYVAETFDTTTLFRQALAVKGAAATHKGLTDEITVTKPLQFKKPGFKL